MHILFEIGESSANSDAMAPTFEGLCVVLTGVLALIAGILAYRAATRDTRYRQYSDKKRELAYTQAMLIVIDELIENIQVIYAKLKEKQAMTMSWSFPLTSCGISIPNEICPIEWEKHSLLNVDEIRILRDLWGKLKEYRLLTEDSQEMYAGEELEKPLKLVSDISIESITLRELFGKSLDQKKAELDIIKL